MRILDRYIGLQIVGGAFLALTVLLSVFALLDFIEDLDSVDKGSYSVLGAIEYSLLTMPSRAFALFPPAALIGTLLGLGTLASRREILVIRAAGVSIQRIAWSVMKAGAVLVIFAIVLGELVSPQSEQMAQQRRSMAVNAELTLETAYGFWVRDKQSFINIRKLEPNGDLSDVYIYTFAEEGVMSSAIYAARASHRGEGWTLHDIKQSTFTADGVEVRPMRRAIWNSPLLPDLVETATVRPESLSMIGLWAHIRYLQENDLSTARFELAFMNKLVYPLATAVMIYLAVAMVLSRSTAMAVGQRIMTGAVVGVSFHLLHNTSVRLGLVYELPSFITALLPTLLFSFAAMLLIRRAQ